MKNNWRIQSPSNAFRRRDFLIGAGRLSAGLALSQLLPESVFAQKVIKGKERLIVRSIRPEDLETPVSLLNTWITPNDLFFVRHHMYAPNVKVDEWKLTVDGEIGRAHVRTPVPEASRMPSFA